ncbi:MAG TPA: beta-galactosidase, partial [Tepidisphaeraceae bacterium]|nr:beta-galactosidase [Tepidisphaeraceae bacterium]
MSPLKALAADPLFIDASTPPPALESASFNMGASHSIDGHDLTLDHTTLLRDGKPWLPVMGEFHFSRYPQSEWRDELLKMKAGGITIVSTYVFWIHHEEIENQWNWSGQRNLRQFAQTCKDAGLPLIVRIGPWDHGEVRNGGFPDWMVSSGLKLRTDDPAFLAKVQTLYQQIADQLKGLLWKDNGPVIGVQLDNEFGGPAQYLLALKKIACNAGLDVPLYTRTGWPNLKTPIPFGEMVPLFGAYAEGFWDRSLDSMPGRYWQAFIFRPQRTDNAVATDQLGQRESPDEADARQYPYLTCELGGGMMSSYHRRILIDPMDVLSVALCKVGSGSNLPGYYMYHGGTNPDSVSPVASDRSSITLQESQSTNFTNYNDMPAKNYDFQAPLGANGEVHPSYHLLRRLHLFLQDWGPSLATMHPFFPTTRPTKNDTENLRWAVRTDGTSGFVFVSNYQRGLPMPAKSDVQFDIRLAGGKLQIPSKPFTVPADSAFLCPFNLDLGGVKLIYATAQPVCHVEDGNTQYFIFAQIPNVPTEFVIDQPGDSPRHYENIRPGTAPAIMLRTNSGKQICIVLLDDETSKQCWKGPFAGRERIFLSHANLIFDNQTLRLQTTDPTDARVSILPADSGEPDGIFHRITTQIQNSPPLLATADSIQPAGPPRKISMGSRNVAAAPTDDDFQSAAIWRIKLPQNIDPHRRLLLRIHYHGDVARLYLDGKLIADDFYNGNPLDLNLNHFSPDAAQKELLLKILPLQKDAPIAYPKAINLDPGAVVDSIEI